jgi:ABC-type multidrug transport system permease subunit
MSKEANPWEVGLLFAGFIVAFSVTAILGFVSMTGGASIPSWWIWSVTIGYVVFGFGVLIYDFIKRKTIEK